MRVRGGVDEGGWRSGLLSCGGVDESAWRSGYGVLWRCGRGWVEERTWVVVEEWTRVHGGADMGLCGGVDEGPGMCMRVCGGVDQSLWRSLEKWMRVHGEVDEGLWWTGRGCGEKWVSLCGDNGWRRVVCGGGGDEGLWRSG